MTREPSPDFVGMYAAPAGRDDENRIWLDDERETVLSLVKNGGDKMLFRIYALDQINHIDVENVDVMDIDLPPREADHEDERSSDWMTTPNIRGAVANDAERRVPGDGRDKEFFVDAFLDLSSLLRAEWDDEMARFPVVDELKARTQKAVVHRSGDETTFEITLTVPDGDVFADDRPEIADGGTPTETLRLSAEAWANQSPSIINQKHTSKFGGTPGISKEAWEKIREYWEEVELESGIYSPKREESYQADAFVAELKHVVRVFHDREMLLNDPERNAWYARADDVEDSEARTRWLVDEQDVLWVPSGLIRDVISDAFSAKMEMQRMKRILSQLGICFPKKNSKDVGGTTPAWAFRPESLDVTEEMVIDSESDGDGTTSSDDGDNSDGGDGGNGGADDAGSSGDSRSYGSAIDDGLGLHGPASDDADEEGSELA